MHQSLGMFLFFTTQTGAPAASLAPWLPYLPVCIQFLLLATTIALFWTGGIQKVRERQAEWYHKVVVDPAIGAIKDFASKLLEILCARATECENVTLTDNERAQLRKLALLNAKQLVYQLRSDMEFRLSTFDHSLEQKFVNELETLEDNVSKWFVKQEVRKCYEAQGSLPEILKLAENRLLQVLMQFEFSMWGFLPPWRGFKAIPSIPTQQ